MSDECPCFRAAFWALLLRPVTRHCVYCLVGSFVCLPLSISVFPGVPVCPHHPVPARLLNVPITGYISSITHLLRLIGDQSEATSCYLSSFVSLMLERVFAILRCLLGNVLSVFWTLVLVLNCVVYSVFATVSHSLFNPGGRGMHMGCAYR